MRTILAILFAFLIFSCESKTSNPLYVNGLKEPVEIIRDQWGINHIYAKNQHDLFFAQGYAAAKDRLFQFEIWRRQATGTVAEILGERELKRDLGTRLFKFRGDMNQEMDHYHKDGTEIITAYTMGVNAYIKEINQTPEKLSIEFKLLNIKPAEWTTDVVISRHQGLLGNINDELQIGRAVAKLGVEKVKELTWFHPKDPNIELDPAIDKELLFDNILE
ncbi:Penicillin acylase (Penicillin amidase), partial [hydrothermal vent metagenome]